MKKREKGSGEMAPCPRKTERRRKSQYQQQPGRRDPSADEKSPKGGLRAGTVLAPAPMAYIMRRLGR